MNSPTKKKRRRRSSNEFDADKILINKRNVFLYKEVNEESATRVIKQLLALDVKRKAPIYFWLNSLGGCCSHGMAIVHAMRSIKSKVITIINTEVCSMGGHISVAGNERWISKNGIFMAHDASGGIGGDYFLKTKDRADFLESYYEKILNGNLRTYTDLSEEQLIRARTGELWLFADDCLKYGVADKIV